VLVDPRLVDGLRGSLDQWYADLCNDGYNTIEQVNTFANPPEIRLWLQNLHRGGSLKGVMLVGDIPHIYQWLEWPGTWYSDPLYYEAASYEYYSDLDGTFSASPGYHSPVHHAYSFDQHTGNIGWELWVGELPMVGKKDPASMVGRTVEAINRYFAKNHQYRTGQYALQPNYMAFEENYGDVTDQSYPYYIQSMTTGTLSWMPMSNAPDARLYMNITDPAKQQKYGYTDTQYLQDLAEGKADFFVHMGHGSYTGMGFVTTDYVQSHPIQTAFYMFGGCDVAQPPEEVGMNDNILTEVLYSPLSRVILTQGNKSFGGNLWAANMEGDYGDVVAAMLANGASFGEGMVKFSNGAPDPQAFKAPILPSLATMGDPTLQLVR
jgi:hypothetical protein